MRHRSGAVTALVAVLVYLSMSPMAHGAIQQFFYSSQVAVPVSSGVTSDKISCDGYLFTFTRDKLFTGGGSVPIGRSVRVPWPQGVEAQAVTAPPPGVSDYKARITFERIDGDVFDINALDFKLLANTAGAGGSLEIMPQFNGEDAFSDPLYFDATGYYGGNFHYDQTPNPYGSTVLLSGYDTYKIGLYVDFALTSLTLQGAPVPEPAALCLAGSCAASVLQRGRRRRSGRRPSCLPTADSRSPAPPPRMRYSKSAR